MEQVRSSIREEKRGKTSAPRAGWLLSEQEADILHSIAAGKSNQEIAQEFVLALSTVKTHLNNIYTKRIASAEILPLIRQVDKRVCDLFARSSGEFPHSLCSQEIE